jgi:imidazolonepropionase-like amidohydrolase
VARMAETTELVIRPGWLIDGRSATPLSRHEVVVEGAEISAVRPVGAAPGPDGAMLLDLPDATLLPGLVDCHAHYTIDASLDIEDGIEQGAGDPRERAVLVGARNARLALQAGVTTARSAGASRGLDIPLAGAIECGDIPGPRLLPAGPAITITGGHGQHFGVEVDSPAEMVRAVRAVVRDGAKVIKLIASEAAMLTSSLAGVPEFTAAEMALMTTEAKRLRRTVLAHAQSSAAVKAAAEAGVHSIEHAFLADEEALLAIRDNGQFLTPTLAVTDVYSRLAGLSDQRRQRQEEISRRHRASCETAIRLGIPLVAGTDCGVRGIFPGMIALEVELLHDHGLSILDAIRAATVNGAELLGLADEIGTVEAGKRADLLVVDGELARDVTRLRKPSYVVQNGAIVHASLITPLH